MFPLSLSCAMLLVAMAIAAPVLAAGTCAGTILTSQLHPLPQSMVVMGAATSITDSQTPELTRRFVNGLQRAGVTIADQGNVTLNIAVSVTAPPTASNVVSGQYRGFEWVSGGRAEGGQVPSIRSAKLNMSAVLVDNVAITQSWVATIECRVQTDDAAALAEDLGLNIGRAFGTNVKETL